MDKKIGKKNLPIFWWIRGESPLACGLGQGGLYSPPDCIHYPPGSTPLSLGSVKKKRHLIGCLFFLVDPRGVEPLSENPLIQLSTWVVGLLEFSYETPSNRLFFGYRFNA